MSAIKEAMTALKEVLLLADRVERVGSTLSEMTKELRDHDRRIIRLETFVEVGKMGRPSKH
ncbi:MAG: hypothetical protein GX642_14160 [Smithella sp.]|jgi:hypothetical protein|nr:hypothetical protein [Smithellaceae bacterium]NLD82296.1 hypothetical protein [Smithella sp.]